MAWRRWRLFKANRRATWSALFLIALSLFSLSAELWSNDRPLVLAYNHQLYFPAFKNYPPSALGMNGTMLADYKQVQLQDGDWALWPLNRWDPFSTNKFAKEFPSPPSRDNWLGTDDRGRDVFARLLYGFRYSLIFSVSVWLLCSVLALTYGGVCGFLGGWADLLGQRVTEILSTVPQLLLLIFVISVFEPSMAILVAISCAFGWIGLSYFVRGEVLRTRCLDYVEASRALGASRVHILWTSILPNCTLPLITFAPFLIVGNFTALAGLDYMGLGLPAPTPSWGELLQQAQTYFTWAWWLAFFPALLLFLTLLTLTLFGEGLRMAFDPGAKLGFTEQHDSPGWFKKWMAKTGDAHQPTGSIMRAPATRAALALVCFLSAVYLTSAFAADSVRIESLSQVVTEPMRFQTSKAFFDGKAGFRRLNSYGVSVEMIEGTANYVRFDGTKGSAYAVIKTGMHSNLKLSTGFHRLRDVFPPDPKLTLTGQGFVTSDLAQANNSVVAYDWIPVYSANYFVNNPNVWEWNITAAHDYVYQEWVAASAACHFLAQDKLLTRVEWVFAPRWRTRIAGNHLWLSDSNTRAENDSSVMFEISNGRHWIMIGAGLYYVGFSRPTSFYWSPVGFADYQLRSENALRWSKEFSTNININVGHGGEFGMAQGFDYYLDARMNYHPKAIMNIGLGWTRMKSLRPDQWERNDLNLTVSADL